MGHQAIPDFCLSLLRQTVCNEERKDIIIEHFRKNHKSQEVYRVSFNALPINPTSLPEESTASMPQSMHLFL